MPNEGLVGHGLVSLVVHRGTIADQCVARGVAYFHKQWGKPSNNPSEADGSSTGGGWLDGVLWRQYPKAPQSVRLPCFPPLGTTV